MSNPFVQSIPVSTTDYGSTLKPLMGIKNAKLFEVPDATTKNQIKNFLTDLYNYDQSPTAEGMQQLNSWLTTLQMNVVRAQESPDDLLIFYPKRLNTKGEVFTKGNTVGPYKIGAVFVWRMGKVQTLAEPNNPVRNFCWVQEHEGSDGTIWVGKSEALDLKGKFGIINAVYPKQVKNVPGKQIRFLTDAAHSDKTIFTPMLQQLKQFFPDMPLILTHGMNESANNKLLIGNDYGRFVNTGDKPSFATLLSIALALQTFGSAGRKEASITVQSRLPDVKVIKNGRTLLLKGNPTTSAIRASGGAINTNVSGRVWYGSTAPMVSRGKSSTGQITDKVIHAEFGGSFRSPDSTWLPKYIDAFKQASWWLLNYNAEQHNPYLMRNIDGAVYRDMSLYPTLFPPMIDVGLAADEVATTSAAAVVTPQPVSALTFSTAATALASDVSMDYVDELLAKIEVPETAENDDIATDNDGEDSDVDHGTDVEDDNDSIADPAEYSYVDEDIDEENPLTMQQLQMAAIVKAATPVTANAPVAVNVAAKPKAKAS